jgi:sulfite exporter TauE/SafE
MNPLLVALVSGFSIGILGSFHCLGMCGPLALSLPIHHLSKANKTFAILSYNFLANQFLFAIPNFNLFCNSISIFNSK